MAVADDPDELLLELGQQLNQRRNDFGRVTSMLVWQDGNLLMEDYYYSSFGAGQLHEVFSTTKSITSSLIGIALDRGLIASLDVNILDYFSEYQPFDNLDVRKQAITLEDLLKMQAGFQWDELTEPYTSPSNSVIQMTDSGQDWIDYVLDLEMIADPGTVFAYSSGVTMLLSGIIEKTTGQSAENFAADVLFRDLGIDRWEWDQSPYGYTNTGWGLKLMPIDMLKFGQLYLNNGYLLPKGESPGKQVVSAEWVAKSIQSYTEGTFPEDIGGPYDYGYQWWSFGNDSETISELSVNDVYFTWGYGGQFIFVVPHLNAVIVATGRNFGNSEKLFPALSDFIFPALQQLAVPEPASISLTLFVLTGMLCVRPRRY